MLKELILRQIQRCSFCSCQMPSGTMALYDTSAKRITHLPGQCGHFYIVKLIYASTATELRINAYTPADAAHEGKAKAKTLHSKRSDSKQSGNSLLSGATESHVHQIQVLDAPTRTILLKVHPNLTEVVSKQSHFQPRLRLSRKTSGRSFTEVETDFEAERIAPMK